MWRVVWHGTESGVNKLFCHFEPHMDETWVRRVPRMTDVIDRSVTFIFRYRHQNLKEWMCHSWALPLIRLSQLQLTCLVTSTMWQDSKNELLSKDVSSIITCSVFHVLCLLCQKMCTWGRAHTHTYIGSSLFWKSSGWAGLQALRENNG